MPLQAKLRIAGNTYSNCANTVAAKLITSNSPNATESELLIAFGIASDWSRRAAALQPLQYSGRLMNRSKKSPAVTEMMRFTMAWSGMNALFARPSVLALLGAAPSGNELKDFEVLFKQSGLSPQDVAAYETALQAVLATPVVTMVPGHPSGVSLPTVQILYEKYTPAGYRAKGLGKKMLASIKSGSTSNLDLATLIYAMRNWSVHGGVIGSSFRSVPRECLNNRQTRPI